MSEARILHDVRLALGLVEGLDLMRNNVGAFDLNAPCKHCGRRPRPGGPRWGVYGLGVGSADLVGHLSGRFLALEIKGPRGVVRPEQLQWLERIRRNGGVAAVVRSADEAVAVVRELGE